MRILFLDDMQIRRDLFAKSHQDCDVVFVETAQQAIDILARDLNFDLIHLDHDLGGEIFCSSELENSGYRVAKFLSEQIFNNPIVIHSFNAIGAKKMLDVLPTAIYRPFCF